MSITRAQVEPPKLCPLCGCRMRLYRAEHFDGYRARCWCAGLAERSERYVVFEFLAGARPRLHRSLAGWHLRWLCAAHRERAQRRQLWT